MQRYVHVIYTCTNRYARAQEAWRARWPRCAGGLGLAARLVAERGPVGEAA